jgi:predicted permease
MMVDLTLDHRVLAFTVVLTFLTGVAFGLVPALQSLRFDLVSTLRAEQASTLGLGRRCFSLKNTLVMVQVTVSVVLLVSTGLVVRALETVRGADLGLEVERVAMLETDARYAGYGGAEAQRVYEELLRRIEGIPGVESAVLANGPPAGGGVRGTHPRLLFDHPVAAGDVLGEEGIAVESILAGPGYYETLGIALLRGRGFEEADDGDAPAVAVVNESMARRYFGTVDAVGRSFRYEATPEVPVTIVGVIRDVGTDVMEAPAPLFYRSFRQGGKATPTVLARTSIDAASVVGSMQSALRQLDPALPVVAAKTMERHVEDSLMAIKAAAAALGGLSLAGLGLAAVGLQAVVSFAVSRRSREIGIRVALGADSAQVVRLVARDVAVLVAAGLALGLALSWLVTLALSALAVDLSASPHLEVAGPQADALTFVAVAMVIALVGIAAAYFPARKAGKLDPLTALRRS